MNIPDLIRRMLEPLRNRVMLMVSRAVVQIVKDSGGIQTMQISLLKDEIKSEVERLQNYGFTSNPQPGAEAGVVFIGGDRDRGLIFAVDDRRYRFKNLAAGEVAMYDDLGQYVHFKKPGDIEVSATTNVKVMAATKIEIDAPTAEIGQGTVESIIKGTTFQALFNAHTHNGNLGAPTGPPITALTGSELSNSGKVGV